MSPLGVVPPEARALLLAIGRLDADALQATVADPAFDWQRLAWLAQREKAVGAVAGVLGQLQPGVIPVDHLDNITRLARVNDFRMLRLESLLADALDVLDGAGVSVMLLKGAGLATTVYGSFSARPMYDVDLLVPGSDADRAWQLLRAAGWVHNEAECPADFYDSHCHLPPLDDPMRTGLALELHRAATEDQDNGGVGLSTELLWGNAVTVTFRGREVRVPCPEHQILHLATHFAWSHGLASAAWRTFRDLRQLMEHASIDWDRLVGDAAETRATTCCYWTFRLARSLAGIPVDDGVLARTRPPRPEWALRIIEHHFAANLFPFSRAPCPSARMTQTLWSAGMAPRWSGHREARPWHRGDEWQGVHGTAEKTSLATRLSDHITRGTQWARYMGAVLR